MKVVEDLLAILAFSMQDLLPYFRIVLFDVKEVQSDLSSVGDS